MSDDEDLRRLKEEAEKTRARRLQLLALPFFRVGIQGVEIHAYLAKDVEKAECALAELTELEATAGRQLREFAEKYPDHYARTMLILEHAKAGTSICICPNQNCLRIVTRAATCERCGCALPTP